MDDSDELNKLLSTVILKGFGQEMSLAKLFGLAAIFTILVIFNLILVVEKDAYSNISYGKRKKRETLKIVVISNSPDWIELQTQFYQVVSKGKQYQTISRSL